MPLFSELLGRYASLVQTGKVFSAYATLTAPVIYSTAAGTGGPLLWNSNTNVDAHVLGIGALTVVASAVAGGLGFTVGGSQTTAPTSTTGIDAVGSCLGGWGSNPQTAPGRNVTAYRVGTVSNAGAMFTPIYQMDTGALTVSNLTPSWVDLAGLFVLKPNTWGSVTASATLTTCQVSIAVIWAEVPTGQTL